MMIYSYKKNSKREFTYAEFIEQLPKQKKALKIEIRNYESKGTSKGLGDYMAEVFAPIENDAPFLARMEEGEKLAIIITIGNRQWQIKFEFEKGTTVLKVTITLGTSITASPPPDKYPVKAGWIKWWV